MADEVYYRVEGPTQTRETAMMQETSQEVWGRSARFSSLPSVKAYRGELPPLQRGIQFTTPIRPQRGSGTLFETRWYYPDTEGVFLRQKDGEDYAAIPADVINRQP